MRYDTFSATPVSPNLDAKVAGIDLSRPLADRQVDELHSALAEYQVLFFRN